MNMLDHALALHTAGFSIFPCCPAVMGDETSGKDPLVQWAKYQERPPTGKEIRAWWSQWPDANIAIVTGKVSGVIVVDVDPRHGGSSAGLPDTYTIKTGGGGTHHYYRYPKNRSERIANQVGVAPGIDVRADGGYVIAASSLHFSGNRYEVQKKMGMQSAPSWAIQAPEKATIDPDHHEKWLSDLLAKGAPEGERNTSLVRLAGYYAAKGLPLDVGLLLCTQWAKGLDHPLPEREVELTVRSAYKAERRRNRPKATEQESKELLPLMTLDEFMLKYGSHEAAWTVQDWLPQDTIAFVISPPQAYKTFLSFDLAVSIASGEPFLGQFPVHDPGPVLIFQQEDPYPSVAERMATIAAARLGRGRVEIDGDKISMPNFGFADLPVYYHDQRQLRFDDDKIMDALENAVKRLRPRLTIIDPLYSAATAEDYMAGAAQRMMRLKDIRDRYGGSFMLIHHTNKSMDTWDRQKLWGSQFLNAFIETSWLLKKPMEGNNTVVHRHHKISGGLPFARVHFDIQGDAYSVKYEEISNEEAQRVMEGTVVTAEDPDQPNRQLVTCYAYMRVFAPCELEEIAGHWKKSVAYVEKLVKQLAVAGLAKTNDGAQWYAMPAEFDLLDPASRKHLEDAKEFAYFDGKRKLPVTAKPPLVRAIAHLLRENFLDKA